MGDFGSFRDKLTRTELETTELRLWKVKKTGVAVIEFGVNDRCDGTSSGKVEIVSYPSKTTII